MATQHRRRTTHAAADGCTSLAASRGKRLVSHIAAIGRSEVQATIVKSFLDAKSLRRYNAIEAEFKREFQPRYSAEEALVRAMTFACWRGEFLREMETARLQREIDSARREDPSIGFREALALAFGKLGKSLHLSHRLELRYEREFYQAHDALLSLREVALAGEPHRIKAAA